MNTKSIIEIFRGDDSDALGYQTIVGTIHTDLDLAGCKAVFRYLGFFQEFDPIPEDGKLTIVIPSASSIQFPPGLGYASLKVYDIDRKVRTFTNRIPVFVSTKTPCRCGGEFDVEFSPFPELEPLKIFIGPNADDFDQYTGFVSKIIDRASLVKYGLAMLTDAMSEDGGASGKAASPLAVKAAYDAVIKELVDNYYTAEQTEEAIDRVAAYYITYTAAGAAFPTYASLANATTVYSGGKVRVPTRNDYCVVLADETHDNAEYRYIYAVAEGETTGSWQPQFPVEGVITVDQIVTKNSQNPVSGGGVWSALWGALSALPTGFSSLYDWIVSQLAGKLDKSGGTMTGPLTEKHGLVLGKEVNNDFDGFKVDANGIAMMTNHAGGQSTFGEILTAVQDVPNKANRAANPTAGNLAGLDANGNPTDSLIPAANVATKGEIRYTLPETATAISSASSEVISGETVYYGAATLADRTQNQVLVLVALDELRVTIPPAVSGKVRDFGLIVGVGLGEGTALAAPALVPVAPTGETITMMNAEGEMPTLADGTTTASGFTVLYFTEIGNGTFLVKGEQIQEVA